MDISFYEEHVMPVNSPRENKMYDKSALQLDLNSNAPRRPKHLFDNVNVNNNAILTSPDLNLLKLDSPELEKLIIQNAGGLLTTPTPTTLFKRDLTITEEQEIYARGFVEALQKLHQQAQPEASAVVTSSESSKSLPTTETISRNPLFTGRTLVSSSNESVLTKLTSCTNSLSGAPNTLSTISTNSLPLETLAPVVAFSETGNPPQAREIIYPKFQLQQPTSNTIPFQTLGYGQPSTSQTQVSSGSNFDEQGGQVVPGTPPLPPIDLDLQEERKNLRKKQRNRKAASKCRKRKLEREAQLEMKVKEEKERHHKLQLVAVELRKQVCELKEQVMKHVSAGCKVMLAGQSEGIMV
mgnify:CR=1 FL=1